MLSVRIWQPAFVSLFLFAFLMPRVNADDTDTRRAAATFLAQHQIDTVSPAAPPNYDDIRAKIAATVDPETKFHPYIFALAGRHKQLLSADQRPLVSKLIAQRHVVVNWHDVRNIIRIHAQMKLWDYAVANSDESAKRLTEWQQWTDLRLAYMAQEHIALDRFQRAMWAIYTPQQRQQIVLGEWEKYIKKNVGHRRLFSADKQARRALGEPQHLTEFDTATDNWREKWPSVLDAYHRASRFERQREFAMDAADEAFAIKAWAESEAAFRRFAETECHAIRAVVQAGYDQNAALMQKADNYISKLRSDMNKKYGADVVQQVTGTRSGKK